MNIKQKIFGYLAAIFFISIIIVSIYNYTQKTVIDFAPEPTYLSDEKISLDQSIDQNMPELKVLKYIPYTFSNDYYDYRLVTVSIAPAKLNVYLTPKFTDPTLAESNFKTTKTEILNWIISKGTLASDLQIDFYQDNNSQKTLIEQINQS
jgi:hypothetical protein